ncbi:MAG: hypothetical protein HZB35_09430 [Nitrospirae bacterium]|nr:hypothetical protein [Nitrospirota bacterium]
MSIEFSQIHNIVRTYQRVLDLDPAEGSDRSPAAANGADHESTDKVSISQEARQLQEVTSARRDGGPEADLFKR